jgi:hypothetical protein
MLWAQAWGQHDYFAGKLSPEDCDKNTKRSDSDTDPPGEKSFCTFLLCITSGTDGWLAIIYNVTRNTRDVSISFSCTKLYVIIIIED